uniref:ABC transporter ATP-binding protein n=1 Tax=Ndongobacter massiliensis TaxID=1871025 RepID=UPI000930E121|nr:ABC transporter ATP-binding protein [Ndongobacter massiliensis]
MGILLQTRDLTKRFGDFTANDNISLEVNEGEIKSIVGENGAGKTTLMNMLYGALQPTSGDIYIRQEKVRFRSPKDAIARGIGMVHQHFMLVPSFSVYENILLGTEIANERIPFFVDKKKEIQKCQELVNRYGFDLDVREKVANLSVGQQQKIEILKMLYREVELLILDEPTSVLTPQEVDELLAQLLDLKKKGKTIIMITHKLREVMQVSDSITIIKKGQVIGNVLAKDTDETQLAQMMVGRRVLLTVQNTHEKSATQNVLYSVNNLSTTDETGKKVVHQLGFDLHEGEIYGIAGVEGNGQSELVKMLTGMMEATEGSVVYKGHDVTNFWADDLRTVGLGFIPEDRYAEGLCQGMSLSQNSIAGDIKSKKYSNHGMFDRRKVKEHCQRLIDSYDIRIADFDGNVSQLSGGNAQKLIIAREMDREPDLLIACQPTRGVDIGAIEFIHRQLLEFRKSGGAILLISSELSEIMSLSDRIGVMYKGQIIGEMDAASATETELGLLMAGIAPEKAQEVQA